MPDKEFSISAGTLYEINKTILKESKKVLRGKTCFNFMKSIFFSYIL